MEPLDLGLNVAIMHIASKLFPLGFDVTDQAPATFEALKAHLDAGNRMVVYRGGSDHTIYGDPEVNWCFRAWHDWCHWRGQHDLSLAGEHAVCQMQTWHLLKLYWSGKQLRRWSRIIRVEIIGQAEFYKEHGHFPENQYEFVRGYLQDPSRSFANVNGKGSE